MNCGTCIFWTKRTISNKEYRGRDCSNFEKSIGRGFTVLIMSANTIIALIWTL